MESSNEKHAQLIDRINMNLKEYHNSLLSYEKDQIIEMAEKVAAMSDAHAYMGYHGFSDDEIDFLLQFKNPLEIVAEGWLDYHADIDAEMGFAFDTVFRHKQDWLGNYPLMNGIDSPPYNGLRQFMGVNLIDFLGAIAEKTILHHPHDWKIDIEALWEAALSKNIEEKQLMWHVSSYGTHILNERDVFIKDTGPFGYWTNYRQNDPDMFGYAIEVTGCDGDDVLGNVYEVGKYAEYAKHISEIAEPLESLTLVYSDEWGVNAGKAITVTRNEYDNDRHRLMSESGQVIDLIYHPQDKVRLAALISNERLQRKRYPIGNTQEHLQQLSEKLAKIRTPAKVEPEQKPRLDEQIRAAGEKVKAQTAKNDNTSPKREEIS